MLKPIILKDFLLLRLAGIWSNPIDEIYIYLFSCLFPTFREWPKMPLDECGPLIFKHRRKGIHSLLLVVQETIENNQSWMLVIEHTALDRALSDPFWISDDFVHQRKLERISRNEFFLECGLL